MPLVYISALPVALRSHWIQTSLSQNQRAQHQSFGNHPNPLITGTGRIQLHLGSGRGMYAHLPRSGSVRARKGWSFQLIIKLRGFTAETTIPSKLSIPDCGNCQLYSVAYEEPLLQTLLLILPQFIFLIKCIVDSLNTNILQYSESVTLSKS